MKNLGEYDVVLKDRDGCDICTDLVQGLGAAKARAKYLLSAEHARAMETTHQDLGTFTVQVQACRTGAVLWDAFIEVAA